MPEYSAPRSVSVRLKKSVCPPQRSDGNLVPERARFGYAEPGCGRRDRRGVPDRDRRRHAPTSSGACEQAIHPVRWRRRARFLAQRRLEVGAEHAWGRHGVELPRRDRQRAARPVGGRRRPQRRRDEERIGGAGGPPSGLRSLSSGGRDLVFLGHALESGTAAPCETPPAMSKWVSRGGNHKSFREFPSISESEQQKFDRGYSLAARGHRSV